MNFITRSYIRCLLTVGQQALAVGAALEGAARRTKRKAVRAQATRVPCSCGYMGKRHVFKYTDCTHSVCPQCLDLEVIT